MKRAKLKLLRPSSRETAGDIPSAVSVARRLKKLSRLRPTLAMVLGSGFQNALSKFELDAEASYTQLPGFAPVGVTGHAGTLLIGRLGGTPVLVLCGRAHYYEGHSMARITFPVRVLAAYGIRDLLLTNAAGAVRGSFRAGDFMAITDHINFIGCNPLLGSRLCGANPFVDLTQVYDPGLRMLLQRAARQCGVRLRSGVYLAVSGPSYETPAEIRAFARLGADAVGMSTVPEAIVARQCDLRVAGLSCLTNLAAGRTRASLSHGEVLATAERMKSLAAQMLKTFAKFYGRSY